MTKPFLQGYRVNGIGLFLEFRKQDTAQHLVMMPAGLETIPGIGVNQTPTYPMMFSRNLSASAPDPRWRITSASSATLGMTLTNDGRDFVAVSDTAFAVDVADDHFSKFVNTFAGAIRSGGWAMHGMPVTFEIAQEDFNKAAVADVPTGMIARAYAARRIAGGGPLYPNGPTV